MAKKVTLRTGKTADAKIAHLVSRVMRDTVRKDPILAVELHRRAKDPSHTPFGDCGSRMDATGLTTGNGTVMSAEAAIIIDACMKGSGLAMQWVNPQG